MTPWATREELEAAVADYQSNWWRGNDDALAVINDRTAHPRLRAQLVATSALGQVVSTTDVYRPSSSGATEDRPYLEERIRLHHQIAADCVPGDPNLPTAETAYPSAYFTIGCPGAGKTSVLRDIVNQHRNRQAAGADPDPCSIIDADRVRQLLPEYADGRGALVVQQECFDLTYGPVFDQAIARRADMIFDTMGRLSIKESFERLRAEGFGIHVLHASSPFDLCRERTERRALRVDGRLVSPDLIRDAIRFAEETMGALLAERYPLESWAKIDTTDMSVPTLIEGTAPWSDLW